MRGLAKLSPVLPAVLFAVLPILHLYARNQEEVPLAELRVPLLLAGVAALALVGVLWLVLRSGARAAVVASLFWVWFFSFAQLTKFFDFMGNAATWCALGLGGAVLLGVMLASRGSRNLRPLVGPLAVTALALVLWEGGGIGLAEYARVRSLAQLHLHTPPPLVAHAATPLRPNIYLIVLDGHARSDVLKELFRYDDAPFLQALEQRGFQVAPKARANYCQTLLSLASALNLDYLPDLAQRLSLREDAREPLQRLHDHNLVFSFLRQQGYRIVMFPSDYDLLTVTTADTVMRPEVVISEFETAVLGLTPLGSGSQGTGLGRMGSTSRNINALRYTFDHLADPLRQERPVFVYAHLVAPHPPFSVTRDGKRRFDPGCSDMTDGSHFPGTKTDYVKGYVEKVQFTDRHVLETIDRIQSAATRPTAIVLISDHGSGLTLDWSSFERTGMKERLSILTAVSLPGKGKVELPSNVSLVNVFRIVLNGYFETRLPLLPNESYYSTWEDPYRFRSLRDHPRAVAKQKLLKSRSH